MPPRKLVNEQAKGWLGAHLVPGALLEIIDSYIAYSCSG